MPVGWRAALPTARVLAPRPRPLPQCGPGPICGTGNLADCGDTVGDNITILPQVQSDLNNLSLSLVGVETLYGLCADGRAGGGETRLNKIGVRAGDNQTAAPWPRMRGAGTLVPQHGRLRRGWDGDVPILHDRRDHGLAARPGCIVSSTELVQTKPALPTPRCSAREGPTVQGIKDSRSRGADLPATDDGGDPDIPTVRRRSTPRARRPSRSCTRATRPRAPPRGTGRCDVQRSRP
jgi:hypothetical protein